MLSKRIISGILGISFFYLVINWGSLPFLLLTAVLVILGINEYCNLLGNKFYYNKILLSFLAVGFLLSGYYYNLFSVFTGFSVFMIIIVLFFYHIHNYSYEKITSSLAINFFGIIYIAGGLLFLSYLRDFNLEPLVHARAVWMVLLGTWSVDTGAYFAGRFWGQRKMTPRISPNKTVAGAVGGILAAVIAISIFALSVGIFSVYIVIYAFLLAIAAISGDLFESALKRDMQIKDSGAIIPGHGGILDRFDSLLFTLPLSYFFLMFIFH
ncbi:MAG: phosphatidate cytidylyltransferase [Halanaerobiaceae bacterium]